MAIDLVRLPLPCLLALHLLLSQRPLAEVAAVVEVNTHTAHMVVHVEWLLEYVVQSGDLLGSGPWSCAICTSSDCVISLRLCFRKVQLHEWRRCRLMYA
ncbi:hypothetical protein EDB83DRAFT_2445743 [Lactarius deliciosus]|nr:hypothetical protein EDB83DRAFT_2450130 [Lactarius deliciosus]KAH9012392.1 hypothetical protein EDB83DRAFT_2445743 [Lactarius deliciosus]